MDNPKLTDEQRNALKKSGGTEAVVEDEQTATQYVIVSMQVHTEAKQALREKADRESIQRGIDDAEAGRVCSGEELTRHVKSDLGIA